MNASLLASALISTWGGILGIIVAQGLIGAIAWTWKAHDFKIGKYIIFWPLYALFVAGVAVDYWNDHVLIDFDDYMAQLEMATEVFSLSSVSALLLLLTVRSRKVG